MRFSVRSPLVNRRTLGRSPIAFDFIRVPLLFSDNYRGDPTFSPQRETVNGRSVRPLSRRGFPREISTNRERVSPNLGGFTLYHPRSHPQPCYRVAQHNRRRQRANFRCSGHFQFSRPSKLDTFSKFKRNIFYLYSNCMGSVIDHRFSVYSVIQGSFFNTETWHFHE